jgi:hypothetical protein
MMQFARGDFGEPSVACLPRLFPILREAKM